MYPLMRPHIAYVHNEPCATLARHFCDDLGRFVLKDDKGWQGTTHFATICNVSYHSTILYSAPFHFCNLFLTFSDAFRPFATFLDFTLFNTPPDCITFSGKFHQTLFTWLVHHSFGFSRYYIGPIGLALYWCFELHSIIIAVLMFLVTTTTK